MTRYDETWDVLVIRALAQGQTNLDAFMRQAINAGMSEQALMEALEADLAGDGPIFGAFFRSITGAASSSVMAALRQGETLGWLAAAEKAGKQIKQVARLGIDIEEAIRNGDTDAADEVERAAEESISEMWVAELRNTCYRCLPLHGVVMSHAEWRAEGLHPDSIHPASWNTPCHCKLIPQEPGEVRENRTEQMAPLRRIRLKDPSGKKTGRTVRGVLQADVDKARAARDQAVQSPEGRALLRKLGQARKANGDER